MQTFNDSGHIRRKLKAELNIQKSYLRVGERKLCLGLWVLPHVMKNMFEQRKL